jgi:hypothetical protein
MRIVFARLTELCNTLCRMLDSNLVTRKPIYVAVRLYACVRVQPVLKHGPRSLTYVQGVHGKRAVRN